jgi:MoCo/4Fe-4S cofactor protein with predicted Tat translocation signal
MSSMNDSPNKPKYWRSLAELENLPEFRDFVEREFREPLEAEPPDSPGRRRFMQLMGASLGLAGVTGCRWKEDHILPHSRRPEGEIPGEPRYYATTMDLAGSVVGLHVKSFDGRPIKVEGNPNSSASRGGVFAAQQASVLGLYDPDRSQSVMRFVPSRTNASLEEFWAFARPLMRDLKKRAGAGLRVLSEVSTSPSLEAMKRALLARFPEARWVEYEPARSNSERAGSTLAFGAPHSTLLKPEKARLIVSLAADFIGPNYPGALGYSRAVAASRRPETGSMSRIYVIEPSFSSIGALADHRLALKASAIKAVVAALDAAISAKAQPLPELGAAQSKPDAALLADPAVEKFVRVLVSDLLDKDNLGKSLIVAGPDQPAEVHAVVHRLNALLGNAGQTVAYLEQPASDAPEGLAALKQLSAELGAGSVDTLLILGGNPVHNAPSDFGFEAALAKAKNSIHLSLYQDETSRLSNWHVPAAHFLETWGDARAHDGTLHLAQPLIAPLFSGISAIELIAELIENAETKGDAIVRATLKSVLPNEGTWRKAVHDGFVTGSTAPEASPKLKPIAAFTFSDAEKAAPGAQNGQLEVVFTLDDKIHDGRFANNGWLQELPHPVSKMTWETAALISPKTAEALGIGDGSLVKVSVGGKDISLPALQTPGQAEGSVRLSLGYGRKVAGIVGGNVAEGIAPVGVDVYPLRTSENFHLANGASLASVGGRQFLAVTQDLHAIDQVGKDGVEERLGQIVREGTLAEYVKNPAFAKEKVHHPPLLSLWQDPVSYDGHKWGMTIDLGKCTGCSACVTACQAENNIPVVGKERIERGREMLWLRIDRYFKGTPENPEITNQPVPCQQCENAPCEQVCPVGATMHTHEGLNDMVYNRCIGTRYCSNNCPYKVRHFNYFNYNVDVYGVTPFTGTDDPRAKLKSMVWNPDVTVRSRGVMEKCTYCVQRLQNVKIKAKNAKRAIADGEVTAACQQSCPTDAISFGDLNDKSSRVLREQRFPRAYALLGELNNRPRTLYLAKISNPHPDLAPAEVAEEHGSHSEHG